MKTPYRNYLNKFLKGGKIKMLGAIKAVLHIGIILADSAIIYFIIKRWKKGRE